MAILGLNVQSNPTPASAVRAEIQPGLWMDSRLALWLPAEQLLVVADLHWGYASSHRARGNLLPWWGDAEIAGRLDALVAEYRPAEMLWLGDIVHAAEGAAGAEAWLRAASVPVTVLTGNHDRRWRRAGTRVATRGRFFFHHGDAAPDAPPGCIEVVGHHHPAASWGDAAGSRLRLPALVAGPRRLILPAFSPWAAGTPWNDQLGPEDILWAIAPTRIFILSRPARSTAPAAL